MDNVLEHIENPSLIFNMVSNSLKVCGIFIIIVPNKNDIRRFLPE